MKFYKFEVTFVKILLVQSKILFARHTSNNTVKLNKRSTQFATYVCTHVHNQHYLHSTRPKGSSKVISLELSIRHTVSIHVSDIKRLELKVDLYNFDRPRRLRPAINWTERRDATESVVGKSGVLHTWGIWHLRHCYVDNRVPMSRYTLRET